MATKAEVFEILTVLAAVYPRFELSKEAVGAYTLLLSDLDPDELRAAAKDCATKGVFFPSVHEIRKAVVEMRRKSNKVPTAYEAWNEVLTAGPEVRKKVIQTEKGWTIKESRFVFSHPLVEQVARQLGWSSTFPSGDNEMADRAHFLKAYNQAVDDAMDYEITLPEVREFIESRQGKELEAGDD